MKRTAVLVFLFAGLMLTLSCQKTPQGILAKANPRYEAGKYDEGLDNPKPTAGECESNRAPKMRVDFP
jgi:hypothetical protein